MLILPVSSCPAWGLAHSDCQYHICDTETRASLGQRGDFEQTGMIPKRLLGGGICPQLLKSSLLHPHMGSPSGDRLSGDRLSEESAEWKEAKVPSGPLGPSFCLQRKATVHSLISRVSNFPVPSWEWEGEKRLSQMHTIKINHA